jgi:N-acetylneuraminate synthase
MSIHIEGRLVGPGAPAYLVAELSGNHDGSLERALATVRAAAAAGADAIKLQTYTPDTLTIRAPQPDFVVPGDGVWGGRTLYDLYEQAHTPWDWHRALFDEARSRGLAIFSTPFDATAVALLENLGCPAYKIASFELIDDELLETVAATGKPIIASTGMATREEIQHAVDVLHAAGSRELLLLRCTSSYPAPDDAMNLATMRELAGLSGGAVGLSDHSQGVLGAVVAVALGACLIEKHFTLSRDGGVDSHFSLEPGEFRTLVQEVRRAEAMTGTVSFGAGAAEEGSLVFRRSIYVVGDIKAGELFSRDNVRVIRPGYGLAPRHLREVLGAASTVGLPRGTALKWEHVVGVERNGEGQMNTTAITQRVGQLRIVAGGPSTKPEPAGLRTLVEAAGLTIQASGDAEQYQASDGSLWVAIGRMIASGARDSSTGVALSRIAETQVAAPADIPAQGRFILVRVARDGVCDVWLDAFSQRDLFIYEEGGATWLATSVDLLPASARRDPDQMALAHALTVYGMRPPKRHTFYGGVRRLGVDESVHIVSGRAEVKTHPFEPVRSEALTPDLLNEYADTFLEAIRRHASPDGNIVFLSSGWDSTSILAALVHIVGPEKVRAVIGRMRYADRSGIINQFELDRAAAFAAYFNVPLEIVELDYRSSAGEQLEAVRPLFRAQQIGSLTGLNHAALARGAARLARGGETVFAGEISDGAHNLGFSQFATYFHDVIAFREYFDKAAGYLFSPSFFRLLSAGRHDEDPIYSMFRGRDRDTHFEPLAPEPLRGRQLLASLFLRPGGRIPLLSIQNGRFLSPAGQQAYAAQMEGAYLADAGARLTPETLYAWYLHLYSSFHWQGSTVATLPLTVEASGLSAALPFYDRDLLHVLARMPETAGRALDLHPTKYPLKWTLTHRLRYPMHLQEGPHSYLYDVDPTFSHSAEILYGSDLGRIFRDRLRTRDYQQWLSPEVFDLDYVNGVVSRYLDGTEARGAEMNDLMALSLVTMVGFFEDA